VSICDYLIPMNQLLPGTEVAARGLRWEVVFTQPLGPQTLCRLRGIEGALMGKELDLLNPFEVTCDQYAHVLSTFSHSSYKDAPHQCLAAFADLQSIGLEAFTQKHDPYWDIPLNENLPQPVIDLPIPAAAPGESPGPHIGELFDFQTTLTSPGSGTLFTEQQGVKSKRSRKSN
jgi:hypothetical protein